MPSEKDLLIVFVKNLRPGNVKTRLADAVGDHEAVEIYHQLLNYTKDIVAPLNVSVQVWYSDFIPLNDLWDDIDVQKRTQVGHTLGERMKYSFEIGFHEKFTNVVIIGSDCAELTTNILSRSFNNLNTHDAVIGPSEDGGYYLLGMKRLYSQLFENKEWSTESVLTDTLSDLDDLGISFTRLPELNDVDTIADWQKVKSRLSSIEK